MCTRDLTTYRWNKPEREREDTNDSCCVIYLTTQIPIIPVRTSPSRLPNPSSPSSSPVSPTVTSRVQYRYADSNSCRCHPCPAVCHGHGRGVVRPSLSWIQFIHSHSNKKSAANNGDPPTELNSVHSLSSAERTGRAVSLSYG